MIQFCISLNWMERSSELNSLSSNLLAKLNLENAVIKFWVFIAAHSASCRLGLHCLAACVGSDTVC